MDPLQGSVGEYVSKVYQYDPPGSVYKVSALLCPPVVCILVSLNGLAFVVGLLY